METDQQAPTPNEKLPQMWELSTRPWLYALSQKYGKPITKLSQIPMSEFQALRNKGVDIVWMMGLWKLGTYAFFFLISLLMIHISTSSVIKL